MWRCVVARETDPVNLLNLCKAQSAAEDDRLVDFTLEAARHVLVTPQLHVSVDIGCDVRDGVGRGSEVTLAVAQVSLAGRRRNRYGNQVPDIVFRIQTGAIAVLRIGPVIANLLVCNIQTRGRTTAATVEDHPRIVRYLPFGFDPGKHRYFTGIDNIHAGRHYTLCSAKPGRCIRVILDSTRPAQRIVRSVETVAAANLLISQTTAALTKTPIGMGIEPVNQTFIAVWRGLGKKRHLRHGAGHRAISVACDDCIIASRIRAQWNAQATILRAFNGGSILVPLVAHRLGTASQHLKSVGKLRILINPNALGRSRKNRHGARTILALVPEG